MANEIVKEILHPDNNDNIDIYPKTSYDQVEGRPNLENGTGTGSLVQKRLKSDGVTWTTAKAYQGASSAFGGNTQAGRTEGEFNAYFWDSTKNVPLNGGKGKDNNGNILDNNGLTYVKSYSYALAEGESTKALGRSSHSEGNATQSIGDHSHSEGLNTKAEGYAAHTEGAYTEAYYTGSHAEGNHTKTYAPYQHVGGTYNYYNKDALYQVGNGASDNDRKNAFEVLKDGRAKVQSAPVDDNDVVRKVDLMRLYRHTLRLVGMSDTYPNLSYIAFYSTRQSRYSLSELPNLQGCTAVYYKNEKQYIAVIVSNSFVSSENVMDIFYSTNETNDAKSGIYNSISLYTVTEL